MKNLNKKWVFTFVFLILGTITALAQSNIITETYQPDPVNGQDAIVSFLFDCSVPANYHNANYGNLTSLIARTWSFNSITEDCDTGKTRSFIRFSEVDLIPVGANIISATLHLYGKGSGSTNSWPSQSSSFFSNPIYIGEVQSSWDEQTLTWSNQPSVDYTTYNVTHVASTQGYEDISIDVTSIVADQVLGNNFGFGIKLQTEERYRGWYWASSDFETDSLRPMLVVKYSIPCSADFTFCYDTHNSQYTFTPNSQNGDNYHWNFGNGIGIVTNQPATIPITYQPGSYKVCLTVENIPYGKCKECFYLCVKKIHPDDTPQSRTKATNTSLDTNKGVSILNIYPNPATQQFTLNIEMEKSGNGKLIIYDMTGKPISEKSVTFIKGIQTLKQQCSGLSAGIYMCTIIMDDKSDSKTFIVE